MRLYTIGSGPNFSISGVSASNCTGTFSDAGFSVGYVSNGATPNPVDLVSVSNCTLTGPAAIELGENFGRITFSNVKQQSVERIRVRWLLSSDLFSRIPPGHKMSPQ
jgi:hypothetical protein